MNSTGYLSKVVVIETLPSVKGYAHVAVVLQLTQQLHCGLLALDVFFVRAIGVLK